MRVHPLSFSEVLEDEYRYFHGDIAYGKVELESKHVRQIEDLDKRLAFHRDAKDKVSRWKVLAGAVSTEGDRTVAIVNGLNLLLRRETLLEELLADEEVPDLLTPEIRHALLRVPVARGLLFRNAKVSPSVAADPDLIDGFAARSAAIRVLHAHAPELFGNEPLLLPLIADDERIEQKILGDPAQAATLLREAFPAPPERTLADRARSLRQRIEAEPAAASKKPDAASLCRTFGVEPRQDDVIPEAELSRFNALLIETVYADYVCDGYGMRAMYAAIHAKEPAALCLSGGGIRSATFNLGVLQGMADHRMLNRFHYISTVSGGGYIGSWLSSWMRRHTEGTIGVAKDLSRVPTDPLQPEVDPIRHLREYSSYLAPRATAFSLDSWTLVATYVRNLLLNWTMLLPALIAALLVPRLLQSFVLSSIGHETMAWAAMIAATLSVIVMGVVRPASELPANERDRRWRKRALPYWLTLLIASAFFFCTCWAHPDNLFDDRWWILPMAFMAGSAFGALIFGVRYGIRSAEDKLDAAKRIAAEMLAAGASGAFAGWLLMYSFSRLFPSDELAFGANLEIYVCLAVPLYLMVFFAQSTLLVGLTTQLSADYDREWWARSAAAVFVFCVVHAGASFAVLLLPVLIYERTAITAPVGGVSGIGAWLLSRKWKSVKGKEAGAKLMPLLRLAATITLLFVIAAIAMLTSGALVWFNEEIDKRAPADLTAVGSWRETPLAFLMTKLDPRSPWAPEDLRPISQRYVDGLRVTRLTTLWIFLIAAVAVAWIMALVLNVNIYSMHGMYRNRLIRAYLGASRWIRMPDPFTGFDPQDNVEMWNLRPQCLWQTSFINFERFTTDLAGKEWWKNPNVDRKRDGATLLDVQWARGVVTEFNGAPTRERKQALRNEAMTAVVETINNLMRCCDLQHNVPAPRSVQLLDDNRKYLEGEFEKSLKKHVHQAPRLDASIPELPFPKRKMPKGKDIPEELQKKESEKLLEVPPLHVVNASLNLVGGENLAWQERKAASFTITPLHSGSRELSAYCDTAEYGEKITLGTAMAISGAAVSPNMGALSSPAFTFLMTLFNARLGWWIGNPALKTHDQAAPRMSLASLLMEALGKTDKSHDYVFLSDGGHFENLGLYEMVLRRCKYIIVCDASADGRYGFGDLANAVRKIRIDLGVPIEPLVTKYIGPQKDERYGRYCALGKIHYRNIDGGEALGYLVYIKPAIYSDCPTDVRNYANESASFPHETTADQFFSESQFESYRALGRHVIGRICGDEVEKQACVVPNVPRFFANAWAYVNGVEPPVGDVPIANVSDVVAWMRSGLGEKEAPRSVVAG